MKPETTPTAPDYFDDKHCDVWGRVYAELDGEFPSTTVEAYVVELLRWRDAEAYLAEEGPVLYMRDDKGTLKGAIPAPELKVARDASIRVEKLASTLRIRTHVA